MAHSLLDLPPELLASICNSLTPTDITRFGRTCRKANTLVTPNNLTLWQNAFLRQFDDPRDRWRKLSPSARSEAAEREKDWDSYAELRRRWTLYRTLDGLTTNGVEMNHDEVAETVLDILDTARTDSIEGAVVSERDHKHHDDSKNVKWIEECSKFNQLDRFIDEYQSSQPPDTKFASLQDIRHFTRSVARQEKYYRSDAISRLHVLYGLTVNEAEHDTGLGAARRLTYNWHLTSPATDHGPYHLDSSGRVNWQLFEAVCSTIGRNVRRCVNGHFEMPQNIKYSIPNRIPLNPTIPGDWAGVSCAWAGTYAFLDYQDLFHYNVGYVGGPRPSLDDDPEACGDLMRLELKLDDDDKVKNDWRFKTELPVCEDLPVLYFTGTSRGHGMPPRPLISVRGRVSLLPGAREVRWRYLISYGGADQWQLEGVQPGGIRSGGVYGLWSHCDHEAHGPVGPFCYFPFDLVETVH